MSFTASALIKVSFLLFYKLIFVCDKWRFFDIRNVIVNPIIFIVIVWDLGFTATFIFACRSDFRAHWSTTTANELATKCINTFLMTYALSISDFVADVIILLLPVPMFWKLHLPLATQNWSAVSFPAWFAVRSHSIISLLFVYTYCANQSHTCIIDPIFMVAQNHSDWCYTIQAPRPFK